MTENHDLSEREKVELLLPWHETGQLTAEESQLVETYLRKDAGLRRMLELIREEADETIAANESIGMPSPEARDRLMAQIAEEGGDQPERGSLIFSWLKQLGFYDLSPGLAVGGAVAALIIIVQAAIITSMMSSGPAGEGPVLASGEPVSVQSGTFALIRFSENANADEITALLREKRISIVDGPKPGGVFRVRLADKKLPADQARTLMENLRSQADLVAFISLSR